MHSSCAGLKTECPPRPGSRGFTLVEVLVALSVLAIALAAAVQAATVTAESASDLRERTFAHWIADNQLTEMQAGGAWSTGRSTDERAFAGREWPLTIVVEETQFEHVRRVRVSVAAPDDKEQVITTVQGVLRNPEITP